MSAAHTPGPWELRGEFGMQGLVYPKGGEYPVAAVTGYFHRAGQTEWNARLIAAAPDLLDALKGVLRVADRKTDEFDAARAAIAKATGSAA